MFYNIVVSILNMAFVCPKCVPKNVFSLHTLRSAEEYYERVQFTKSEDCCTAESETRRQWQHSFYRRARLGDSGSTVSIKSVFSFYGVEDYCIGYQARHGGAARNHGHQVRHPSQQREPDRHGSVRESLALRGAPKREAKPGQEPAGRRPSLGPRRGDQDCQT